ncbi:PAAR domain-containing protein [Burkholderia glumae]
MSSAFVREDDTTDHCGRVLASTSTKVDLGKPLALESDMMSCPKCGVVYKHLEATNLARKLG